MTTKTVALITGISGQDGAILAEQLLSKGYEVHGLIRRSSSPNLARIKHIQDKLHLHVGDITDGACLQTIINVVRPRELYNLAAQSFVGSSFDMPVYTAQATGMGVVNVLEAVRCAGLTEHTRVLQASSSEMFGLVQSVPQTEGTAFHPRSMYGVSKLFAYWAVRNSRESYSMFAVNSIAMNHESKLRGDEFVTRKISKGVAGIVCGKQECLWLGNLDAQRDWGAAREYTHAMWLMLQRDHPDDYVIATGVTTTVRRFVELAFQAAGESIKWQNEGLDEKGFVSGRCVVKIDPHLYRVCEVDLLIGDASKAEKDLGWKAKVTVEEIADEMVEHDISLIQHP